MGGISSLSTVIIGEGVKTLPDFAFCSCTDLSYVYIPASLEALRSGFCRLPVCEL